MATYTSSSMSGIGTPGIDNLFSESVYTFRLTSNVNPTTSNNSYFIMDGQGENVELAGGRNNLTSVPPQTGSVYTASVGTGNVNLNTFLSFTPVPALTSQVGSITIPMYQDLTATPYPWGTVSTGYGTYTGIDLLITAISSRGAISIVGVMMKNSGVPTQSEFFEGGQVKILSIDMSSAGGIGIPNDNLTATFSSGGFYDNLVYTTATPGTGRIAGLPATEFSTPISGGYNYPSQSFPSLPSFSSSLIANVGLDLKMGMGVFNSGPIASTFQFTPAETMRSQSYVIRSTGEYDLLIDGADEPGGDEYQVTDQYSLDFGSQSNFRYLDLGFEKSNNLKDSFVSSSVGYNPSPLNNVGGINSGSLTISAWINPNDLISQQQNSSIFSFNGNRAIPYNGTGNQDPAYNSNFFMRFMYGGYTGGKIQFGHQYGSGSTKAMISAAIPELVNSVGTWHHILIQRDIHMNGTSGGGWRFYFDGVFQMAGSFAASQSPSGGESSSFQMGRSLNWGASNVTYQYCAQVTSDIAIWNGLYAANNADAALIYNSGQPINPTILPNCVGWWKMGDSEGPSVYPTIEDYSINNNSATMVTMHPGNIIENVPNRTGSL